MGYRRPVMFFFLIFFFAISWIFATGAVKLGYFSGEQWLDIFSSIFGVNPLFKKESDCAFFPDFPKFLRVLPL